MDKEKFFKDLEFKFKVEKKATSLEELEVKFKVLEEYLIDTSLYFKKFGLKIYGFEELEVKNNKEEFDELERKIINFRRLYPTKSFREEEGLHDEYGLFYLEYVEKKLRGYGYFMVLGRGHRDAYYNNILFTAKRLGCNSFTQAIILLGNGDLSLGRNRLHDLHIRFIKLYSYNTK
ncbi:hypothetical protein ACQ1Q1_07320 [Ornithobacterium rhinotracheale]|nr:hypothetical protein [Ornithobacterium rhinotracheale]MCK0194078.1 hypothetical protein [Ornithobacterium rhinotracheale]MCK0203543.1 hypothetical protein [Ornithobacterium rhinotracheale]UOH64122.1 hypothetical protein MT993_02610 [Ornithobacterium rhinotracheale]UOH65854.1 hypothetical protein MT999_00135 [Ornithobacterium rhinotracheale]UVD86384.1 hypothetical protein NV236_06785 [Ornithobacterium rhinotracheale]